MNAVVLLDRGGQFLVQILDAQLRWLTLPAARDTTAEPNLREALTRIEPLLKPPTT